MSDEDRTRQQLVSELEELHRKLDASEDAGQTQNRLAAIVEDSDDAIIAKTLDGVITDWNRGAEAIYGYPAAEVIGRSITLLIPPDQTDEMPAILKKIGQGQSIFNYETVRFEDEKRLI